jgi:hypothetical protein
MTAGEGVVIMLKKVAAGLAMLLLLNGSTEACTTMLAT